MSLSLLLLPSHVKRNMPPKPSTTLKLSCIESPLPKKWENCHLFCKIFLALFGSSLMGKTHTVKWVYCVSVAEGEKTRQARAPVHCSAPWSGGNHGEAHHFSPFPFSRGHHALVKLGLVISLCTLEKKTGFLSSITWRPIKTLRTGAQTRWLQAM